MKTALEKKESNAAWRAAHPARIKEFHSVYRAKHRDRLKERNRAARAVDPEAYQRKRTAWPSYGRKSLPLKKYKPSAANMAKRRIAAKAYYAANLEEMRRKGRERYHANPERARIHTERRRARKLGSAIGDTEIIKKWRLSWWRRKAVPCYWCQRVIPGRKAHQDHITPLAKGGAHAIENLCVSCPSCNRHKHATSPEEWNLKLSQPVMLF